MSIRSIVTTGVGINNGQRDIPTPTPPVVTNTSSAYVRPSDWPALASLTNTSQQLSGLIAITNDNDNYVALTITGTGTYTVDWGDGTVDTGIASGTRAQHQYNYSTYSGSVLTGGYKAAVVNVTMVSGNMTGINLQVKYVIGGTYPVLPNGVNAKWLDISLGSPFLTALVIGGLTLTVGMGMLQQIQIFSLATSYVNYGNLFYNLYAVQSYPTLNFSPNYSSLSGAFAFNHSLKVAPTLPSSSVNVNGSNLYYTCLSLETITTSSLANVNFNNVSGFFFQCKSLKIAPQINIASGTTAFTDMFLNCQSLISVPKYNIPSTVTTLQTMFSGCSSLKTIPQFVIPSSVTNTTSMFLNCSNLQTVPLLNLSSVQTLTTMFSGCGALKTVPAFNLSAATTMASMFLNCFSLTTVGNFTTTTALTNCSSTFSSCYSLKTAPTFITTNVTDMSTMFATCYALTTIPTYDTGNLANAAGMFNSCTSLVSIPTLTTTKVTNMAIMFNGCISLTVCPALDTSNVSNMATMFNACNSLQDVLFTNVSNVTNMSTMFGTCNAFNGSTVWSSWNTSKVTNMNSMFSTSVSLNSVPAFNTSNVTDTSSMFQSCLSLNSVPALNLTNASIVTNIFSTAPSISRIQATNLKITTTLVGTNMNQTALQEVFANTLLPNATSQTITITSTPGADTAVTRAGNTTANSSVILMSNTVGLTANMVMTSGNGFGTSNRAATLYQANSTIVLTTGTAPVNTMPVSIATAPSGVTGYTQYQPYYVVNSSGNSFQIATTSGGSNIAFTGTGTLSANVLYSTYIGVVSANTAITLSNPANAAFTSNNYTFRNLDVSQAVLKNWTVTG